MVGEVGGWEWNKEGAVEKGGGHGGDYSRRGMGRLRLPLQGQSRP